MYREFSITDQKACHQQCYVKQQPKYINDGILSTMGHPKRRKPYGSGDSVRESDFKRFSSFANIHERSCVSLNELTNLNKNNKKHQKTSGQSQPDDVANRMHRANVV